MKVALIIEAPDSCGECPCCEITESFFGDISRAECRQTGERVEVYVGDCRPDNCPLRILPSKTQEKHHKFGSQREFSRGFNYALTKILGEEE